MTSNTGQTHLNRHNCWTGNTPFVIPAQAGIQNAINGVNQFFSNGLSRFWIVRSSRTMTIDGKIA